MDSDIRIEIMTDHHITSPVSPHRVRAAVAAAAKERGYDQGDIGVRITDDATIQRINLDHLGHDDATDVISFDYGSVAPNIEGEMVVSAETASSRAAELGWSVEHELILYIVHGTLHIAGLDDLSDHDRAIMRAAEQRVMLALGIDEIDRFGPEPIQDLEANHRLLDRRRQEEHR